MSPHARSLVELLGLLALFAAGHVVVGWAARGWREAQRERDAERRAVERAR
jgi:hypothetical protein